MSQGDTSAPEQMTFEQGYEELKRIVARLNDDDISVHEMFDSFRRGKGLEKALRGYLTEREGELTEIEQGNNLPEFEIVAPSRPSSVTQEDAAPSAGEQLFAAKTPVAGGGIDTEIPF